ncbi:PP2C family protein-serine/threonine phosphatase [Planococcus lenghuensis]|uniref:Phosphoserine phosphatase n=1 Tax=Planococcus lenghuensis TaxID=2213202 RepID=A0A1Q2KV97_9BACL|nr:PP2C family protein-serine/threonine phosphatase [Planococcus lenghuensis]AQQ52145.1 phosphoserine phosphatase [Planococcus lenghuensis]
MVQIIESQYKEILAQYIREQSEQNLYAGQILSRQFLQENVQPEEVISMHKAALAGLHGELPDEVWHSFDLLIEMMISYGMANRERQSLVQKQEELRVEMDLASHVQETLLKTQRPEIAGLDVGVISVPSRAMNGDYIYFVYDESGSAGVAVADVIGKGIPAALCMSMIKFGLDSLNDAAAHPSDVLGVINRIVEKSIDDSMFISMFYGQYNAEDGRLTYGSAGHEPALLYRAETDTFEELRARGLLLGVSPKAKYEDRSVQLHTGDLVIAMTDGVTEGRTEVGFIDHEVIFDMVRHKKDASAQEIAEYLYEELSRMQQAELRDDFTLVIYKKS